MAGLSHRRCASPAMTVHWTHSHKLLYAITTGALASSTFDLMDPARPPWLVVSSLTLGGTCHQPREDEAYVNRCNSGTVNVVASIARRPHRRTGGSHVGPHRLCGCAFQPSNPLGSPSMGDSFAIVVRPRCASCLSACMPGAPGWYSARRSSPHNSQPTRTSAPPPHRRVRGSKAPRASNTSTTSLL